ncbi:MAG: class I tRNA ligase family protein, partial [Bdellovibrionales bacterium]|nr:class I tRNA ligase family protein [Bdellovibrionales bacterium]
FLKKPLQDLCISRPKKRISWGVELPFDSNYVAYVWVDALLNYITGVGYGGTEEDKNSFEKWWMQAGAVHFIGKDILITHGIYWPCLLMALGLPLPKTIVAHGWLLNKSQEKMSKSKGDVLEPLELSQTFGVSALRYVLAREVILGNDAFISRDMIVQRIHQDLSDNPGNILSRLSRLTEKYFDGKIPAPIEGETDFFDLKKLSEQTAHDVRNSVEGFRLSPALEKVNFLWAEINRVLERTAPWKQVKQDSQKAGHVIYSALEALRISAILLSPVMPDKMKELLHTLGKGEASWEDVKWGGLSPEQPLTHGEPLFPKMD